MRPSVAYLVPVFWCLASPSLAAGPAGPAGAVDNAPVQAAESLVSIGTGLAASGAEFAPSGRFAPGFAAGASVLHATAAGVDGYAALDEHLIGGGQNSSRLEARLGTGFALPGEIEIIPYAAIGYQGWSRGDFGGHSGVHGLAGAGAKLDMAVTPHLVVSLGSAFLAMAQAAPEADMALGLDDEADGPVHLFAEAWWVRFGSSTAPAQVRSGVNLGIGYRFY